MNLTFPSVKKLPLILHTMAWAILFIIPIYLITSGSDRDAFFLIRVYSRTIVYALIFYLNYFWLVPRFFFSGKKKSYFLSAALLILITFFALEGANKYIFPERPEEKRISDEFRKLAKENKFKPNNFYIYDYLMTSFLITGFSLGLRFSDKLIQNEKQRKELEKERLHSELAFLKNQISPHFFFNTLNNIYSLIEINTADAQKSILKLSKLMRYLIYESEHGNTQLSREIDFMNNYIDLMKLRINNKVDLKVSFPEKFTDISISPLLFVPFIENAFKHGVSYRDPSFIHVSLEIKDREIVFACNNSIVRHKDDSPSDDSGIGLENVKKRLQLLYPQKHLLTIDVTNQSFSVLLKIETA